MKPLKTLETYYGGNFYFFDFLREPGSFPGTEKINLLRFGLDLSLDGRKSANQTENRFPDFDVNRNLKVGKFEFGAKH